MTQGIGALAHDTSALKMEAVGSVKMFVQSSNITQCINPDNQHLNLQYHENLEPHIKLFDKQCCNNSNGLTILP
jgi:hypothetical protein